MILMTGGTVLKKIYFYIFINLNENFPRIKIGCKQENRRPGKLHDLPVFIAVSNIIDISEPPTPRKCILIFFQKISTNNSNIKYEICICFRNTYIFVLSLLLFSSQVNREFSKGSL